MWDSCFWFAEKYWSNCIAHTHSHRNNNTKKQKHVEIVSFYCHPSELFHKVNSIVLFNRNQIYKTKIRMFLFSLKCKGNFKRKKTSNGWMILTNHAPWISESCIEIKITSNFYFHIFLWCVIKAFDTLQRIVKMKILCYFSLFACNRHWKDKNFLNFW